MLPQIAKLSEELEMFRAALEGTIDRVSPVARVQKLDNAKEFDAELHRALAELGVMGLGVPEEHSGGGGHALEQVVALEVLGRKATSMAVFMVVHYMITRLLRENGTAEQKVRYLGPLAAGTIKASFCLTEAGGGTDILAAMKTRAVREGDGWAPGSPPIATEFTVEARDGGTCVVRVVQSLFASTDDWDEQLSGAESGWPWVWGSAVWSCLSHSGYSSGSPSRRGWSVTLRIGPSSHCSLPPPSPSRPSRSWPRS